MVDDRITLGAQFMHQAAHAQFVVRIAALKSVYFRVNECLQLRGARNGALDALVHGRHFTTHSLADGHDAFRCNGFRFRQAQGDLGHRTGRIAQVLRARHHDGKGEEQHDRHEDADNHSQKTRQGYEIRHRGYLPHLSAIDELCKSKATDGPERRYDRCIAQARSHGAAFQRTQNGQRRASAAIIGRLERRLARGGRFRLCGAGGFWRPRASCLLAGARI